MNKDILTYLRIPFGHLYTHCRCHFHGVIESEPVAMAESAVALPPNDGSDKVTSSITTRLERRNALADVLDETVTKTSADALVDALTKMRAEQGRFSWRNAMIICGQLMCSISSTA